MGIKPETENKAIYESIKKIMLPGTKIPRSRAQEPYLFIRWGRSRGEEALVFQIPTRPGTKKPSEKRIPRSVFEESHKTLLEHGLITCAWFVDTFPEVGKDGLCTFTAVGGVFELLKLATKTNPGIYRYVHAKDWVSPFSLTSSKKR